MQNVKLCNGVEMPMEGFGVFQVPENEFKKKYAEDKATAWQNYLKLCKTGGSRSYLETLRYAELSNPFEDGSVARACGYAEEILLKQIAQQEKNA